MRIESEYFLEPYFRIFLYFIILILYVGICIYLDEEGQAQRLFKCTNFVVVLVESHIVEKIFGGILKPAEIETS